MAWLKIEETCGCGAHIELAGSAGPYNVGYEIKQWRKNHPCPLRTEAMQEQMADD